MSDHNKKNDGLHEERENLSGASNSDHQNASPSRGGTTDMDHNALRGATGNSSRGNQGSGIGTKTGVTGSDYDGQVTDR
jgi:hypothetical protein